MINVTKSFLPPIENYIKLLEGIWSRAHLTNNGPLLMELEEKLKENLAAILGGAYQTAKPEQEGNVNLKKDFNELCKLDLDKEMTMGKAIDHLRALTHGNYANTFFIDSETGSKVYVKISLEKEK